MTGILRKLQDEMGSDLVVGSERLRDRATSYWDPSPTEAKCLVRPETTEQLSRVMRTCHEQGQSVVVQGGLTGIVQGAASTASDVIVSLERMDAIESVDAELIFLPPYSPDFNPIELAFAKLKSLLRTAAARTIQDLEATIGDLLSCFTAKECSNYFRHCGYTLR